IILVTPAALYVSDSYSEHLIALSMANGKPLWQAGFLPTYHLGALAQEQGVVFVELYGPPETNVMERIVALDGLRGTVYWERDQRIFSLVNTPL
ncbi:MAG: hypothetical protein ACRDHP_12700, partial [Ktedonobacterales bacterium]